MRPRTEGVPAFEACRLRRLAPQADEVKGHDPRPHPLPNSRRAGRRRRGARLRALSGPQADDRHRYQHRRRARHLDREEMIRSIWLATIPTIVEQDAVVTIVVFQKHRITTSGTAAQIAFESRVLWLPLIYRA